MPTAHNHQGVRSSYGSTTSLRRFVDRGEVDLLTPISVGKAMVIIGPAAVAPNASGRGLDPNAGCLLRRTATAPASYPEASSCPEWLSPEGRWCRLEGTWLGRMWGPSCSARLHLARAEG